MAGHSKWAQIKRQKGANDQKRGALFTKLTREIMQAAKQGGPDPAGNFKLRLAIQRARAANMPNDNIERAIAKATGGAQEDQLDEITYEGYGPGGIAILVSALTDNRNRTVSEVRHQFSRAGGNLGETGSVAWQFEPRGIITIPLEGRDPDEVALQAIDAGAEDVDVQGDVIEVRTDPASLEAVRKNLETAGLQVENADFAMIPKATIELDEKTAHQVLRLIEALEDLEDVQRVYSNAEFSDEAVASYAG
ncbi:MAG: YebC/PmpR family DNA-binding transcriptional regulator [Tepidiforma sp.]|jgi:YebC/PmpR family DNA-binding regulatory protein|uniref:YebC/PmpR family DNA-binding transcriptional regulator n=1 Tax=Tepidiforma sp. TaxID=2682230 RepID=UPI0021DD9A8C|nr:YebC/PmpR family DNA-binding transcriptional regulator [Tepidiforma sp.]MCX7618223.1 YebC/PmpR family DNA-binding transcriptional regulator [Tepidiforma sp.]GIW16992.1 MAG: putative transcriptional regulatory protein [Tepidiforma sp.]